MESFQKVIDCLLFQDIISLLPLWDQLNLRLVNKAFAAEAAAVLKKRSKLKIWVRCDEYVRRIPRLTRFGTAVTQWLPCKPRHQLEKSPTSLLSFVNVALSPYFDNNKLVTFGKHFGPILRNLTINFPFNSNEPKGVVETKNKAVLKFCTNLEKLRLTSPWSPFYGFKGPAECRSNTLPRFEYLRRIEFIQFPTFFLRFAYDVLLASPNVDTITVDLHDTQIMPRCTAEFFSKLKSLGIVELKLDPLTLNDPPGQSTLLKELIAANLNLKKVVIYIQLPDSVLYDNAAELERGKRKLQEWLTNLTNLKNLEIRVLPSNGIFEVYLPSVMPNLTTFDLGTCGNEDDDPYGGLFKGFNNSFNDRTRSFSGVVKFIPPLCQAQVPKMDTLTIGSVSEVFISKNTFQNVKKLVVKNTINDDKICKESTFLPDTGIWPRQFPNLTSLETYFFDGNERTLIPIFQMKTLVELKLRFSSRDTEDATPIWDIITGGIRPVMDIRTHHDFVIGKTLSRTPRHIPSQNLSASILNLTNLKILKLSTLSASFVPFPTVIYAIVHLSALRMLQPLKQLEIFVVSDMKRMLYFPEPPFYLDGPVTDLLKNYHEQVILTGPHYWNK